MNNTKPVADLDRIVQMSDILTAVCNIRPIMNMTSLERNDELSDRYGAEVLLKREDMTRVRSYKQRGAVNYFTNHASGLRMGAVTASAGNHAQGFAFACRRFQIHGHVFMPLTTPEQKVEAVRRFGNSHVDIHLVGDTFDAAAEEASRFAGKKRLPYVPPFDDLDVIAGQGTVTHEIFEQSRGKVDVIIYPVGGGGLIAGGASYLLSKLNDRNERVRILGIEHDGAPTMRTAFTHGAPYTLESIDGFVDGAAVKKAGKHTFASLKAYGLSMSDFYLLSQGEVCTSLVELHNWGVHAELAGALSVAGLEKVKDLIKDKRVVCVVSGGNIGVERLPEVLEERDLHLGHLKYLRVFIPDRPGALDEFQSLWPQGTNIDSIKYNGNDDSERRGVTYFKLRFKGREGFSTLAKNNQPDPLIEPSFKIEDISRNPYKKDFFA